MNRKPNHFSHFLASEQKTSSTRIFNFYQGVQNGKSNYPNRKSNYFSHLQASDQKTSFTKSSSYLPRSSILILKTGNGFIQTGNRIISPTSRPLFKILCFSFGSIVQNSFSKQEMELLIPFPISNGLTDWLTDIPLAESKYFDLI